MKLVTWNVNSLKARRDHVAAYLDEVRPDLLCLQELKLPDERVPREVFETRGYHLATHGQPTWNGVAIAALTPLTDVHRGLPGADEGQARLLAATWEGIRVVNLYCPQGQDTESPKFQYKLRFLSRLRTWLEEVADPAGSLLLAGDINIAPDPEDVWSVEEMEGQISYHPLEHEAWGRLLEWGLADATRPHLPPHTFSFWDYRQASFRRKRGMRIDHFLVTEPVRARVTGAEVHVAERKKDKPSDHAPLALELADE